MGEIELVNDSPQPDHFEHFESLPNIRLVERLADELRGQVEIMPYQKEDETMKLVVSVYLTPTQRSGRVIVVLLKDNYPRDLETLRLLVAKARTRLGKLSSLSEKFQEKSVASARKNLEQLSARIA